MAQILKKRRKLLLVNRLSPGDVIMQTAAVRDLHRRYPNEFFTDVSTSAQEIWQHNPNITSLGWRMEPIGSQTEPGSDREVLMPKHKIKYIKEDPELEIVECSYSGEYPASINRCNQSAYHFIHGYAQDLGKHLGVDIPITDFHGDIHISEEERGWMSQVNEMGIREDFWIMMAGGKRDFTAKWWDPARYQEIVDHFRDRILFVQCGERSHFHNPLDGVLNLIGKTDIRQYIRLMYHAAGVICGVTFAMHLAAAVPVRPFDDKGRRRSLRRPCVVLAGGREPTHWEAYPHHQYLHTIGALPCCQHGGCWRSRCQLVGDGDEKDEKNLCVLPVQISEDLRIPRCMDMITTEKVIEAIEMHFVGGACRYLEQPVLPKQEKSEPEIKVQTPEPQPELAN